MKVDLLVGGRCSRLEHERVTHVAKFDLLTVLANEDVGTLEVAMCHVLAVEVVESFQCLLGVHTSILFSNLTILFAHLCDAFVHVFKIDAKNVILNDLRVEVLDNVLMLELLVPLDLLLHRFDLLLI